MTESSFGRELQNETPEKGALSQAIGQTTRLNNSPPTISAPVMYCRANLSKKHQQMFQKLENCSGGKHAY